MPPKKMFDVCCLFICLLVSWEHEILAVFCQISTLLLKKKKNIIRISLWKRSKSSHQQRARKKPKNARDLYSVYASIRILSSQIKCISNREIAVTPERQLFTGLTLKSRGENKKRQQCGV